MTTHNEDMSNNEVVDKPVLTNHTSREHSAIVGTSSRKLTKTEQRIVDYLSDGLRHACDELIRCLYDVYLGDVVTVRKHVSNINAKIKPSHEIVAVDTPGKTRTRNPLYLLVRRVNRDE